MVDISVEYKGATLTYNKKEHTWTVKIEGSSIEAGETLERAKEIVDIWRDEQELNRDNSLL